VSSEYLREQGVDFTLDRTQPDLKNNFLGLLDDLRPGGNTAYLRRFDNGYDLVVTRKPPKSSHRTKLPMILLLATIVAVVVDGMFRVNLFTGFGSGPLSLGEEIGYSVIYAISLMGILGIHELGHKISSWHHKMDSSWPYFIPGIPGFWPTFGAVIRAADAPPNRDALVDLGLSGPIAGLAVTFVVSVIAILSANLIPLSSVPAADVVSGDLYTQVLSSLLRPSAIPEVFSGSLFFLLYFAYSIGFLITFVNLLPAWQLDGGHIANSALTPRVHQILTYVSVAIMLLSGFFLMAILVLFASRGAPSLRPLDEVSPLSTKRKVFFVLTFILAASIAVLVIYNNLFFGTLFFKL